MVYGSVLDEYRKSLKMSFWPVRRECALKMTFYMLENRVYDIARQIILIVHIVWYIGLW